MSDRNSEFTEARKQLAKRANVLKRVHGELKSADQLRRSGNLKQAIKKLEDLVNLDGNFFSAWSLLGLIHMQQNNLWGALSCFTRAAMLNPTDISVLINLSAIYARLKSPEIAAQTLDLALRLDPDDLNAQLTLAEILNEELEYEAAAEVAEKAKHAHPKDAHALQTWARCMSNLGELRKAWAGQCEAYRRYKKLKATPDKLVNMLYSLSLNPVGGSELDIVKELQGLEKHLSTSEKSDVFDFALAGALHTQRKYEDSWTVLCRANDRIMSERAEEWKNMRSRMAFSRLYAEDFDSTKVARSRAGGGQTVPIFIVGPSRSGKTTLEGLLGSLAGVKRGFESALVDISIRRASQLSGLPDLSDFWFLPEEADGEFKKNFRHELNRRAGGAKYFTITYPGTIHHAGRLARLIDNAVFVFVVRNRDDQVFRIFQRKYRTSNHYSYSVSTAYEYVDWYYGMSSLWAEKLPGRSVVLRYEEMVNDPLAALDRVRELVPGLGRPAGPVTIADDRDCAAPYLEWLEDAAASKAA